MKPHERLNTAINERRLELGLRWVDITSAAQITDSALRAIRRGDYPPAELTARRLEDALQWQHGSIDAILDGHEPKPTERVDDTSGWNLLEHARRLQEQVNDLVRQAEEQEEQRRRRGA